MALSHNDYSVALNAQMARASRRGAVHLCVNAHDLGCCFGDFTVARYHSFECEEAMEHEVSDGDLIIVPKNNSAGLTVRYLLPRNSLNN
jgi:hypothetical protein